MKHFFYLSVMYPLYIFEFLHLRNIHTVAISVMETHEIGYDFTPITIMQVKKISSNKKQKIIIQITIMNEYIKKKFEDHLVKKKKQNNRVGYVGLRILQVKIEII